MTTQRLPDDPGQGLALRLGLVLEDLAAHGESQLPPETQLARQLDVDAASLHRYLLVLAREGRLTQVKRRGWFVASPKLEIPVARHNSYTANMIELAKRPRSEVIGIDTVRRGEQWFWHLEFRRYLDQLAFSFAQVELPIALTPGLNLHLGKNLSLYQALEREYGIRPERQRTWCEALAADPVVANVLSLPEGAVLLKATHEATWQGSEFEHTVNYLRADACRLRMDLGMVEEEQP